MRGFLDQFRKKVISSVWKDTPCTIEPKKLDDNVALGVLLWVVAEADHRFLPAETEKITEILHDLGKISKDDMPYVISAIQEAEQQRIDLFRFTHAVSNNLDYQVKVSIIEILFSVACVDQDLDNAELECIRKIANLFAITHKDFIEAKIKIKKRFGL